MDKKHKTAKYSLKQASTYCIEKGKKIRTVTGRSPKGIEMTAEQKYVNLSKNKRIPLASQRELHRSQIPFDSPIQTRDS